MIKNLQQDWGERFALDSSPELHNLAIAWHHKRLMVPLELAAVDDLHLDHALRPAACLLTVSCCMVVRLICSSTRSTAVHNQLTDVKVRPPDGRRDGQ